LRQLPVAVAAAIFVSATSLPIHAGILDEKIAAAPAARWTPRFLLPSALPERLPETPRSPVAAMLAPLLSTVVPVTIGIGMTAGCSTHDRVWQTGGASYRCFCVGLALTATGGIFGPSVGHFYSGEVNRGISMTLLRLASIGGGGVVGGIGLGMWKASVYEHMFGDDDDAKSLLGQGIGLFALGIAMLVPGVILMAWDLVDAPRAARRTNDRQDRSLLPVPVLVAGKETGQPLSGFALAGRF